MEKERLKIPSFVIPLKRSLRPKNSKRRGNFLSLLERSKIKYTLKIIYPILSHLSKFDFLILILIFFQHRTRNFITSKHPKQSGKEYIRDFFQSIYITVK